MPYVAIPASWIIAGEPTKEELFQRIKDNQEQFDSDIAILQGTGKINMMNVKYAGEFTHYTDAEILELSPMFKAPNDLKIVSFVVVLLEASTSGTFKVDIQKSTDGITWSTLLTAAQVTLTGTSAGSISGTIPWINPTTSPLISQNDYVRIEITGSQVDQGDFHVSMYGEFS